MIMFMLKLRQAFLKVSVKTFLILFIASAAVSALALRHNNQQMASLRSAVFDADKNNGDVNAALNTLRSYVFTHMNTSVSSGNNNIKPPIQLQYTYQRLYQQQQNSLQQANQKIYAEAQSYCQSINNASYGSSCVQNYVVNHGVKDADINVPAGLYQFDFVSPTWSPDLAGWSLLVSGLLFLAFAARLVYARLRE